MIMHPPRIGDHRCTFQRVNTPLIRVSTKLTAKILNYWKKLHVILPQHFILGTTAQYLRGISFTTVTRHCDNYDLYIYFTSRSIEKTIKYFWSSWKHTLSPSLHICRGDGGLHSQQQHLLMLNNFKLIIHTRSSKAGVTWAWFVGKYRLKWFKWLWHWCFCICSHRDRENQHPAALPPSAMGQKGEFAFFSNIIIAMIDYGQFQVLESV